MAKTGALSQLAKMLVGHSVPANSFDINMHDLLKTLTLPDERLLYHSGQNPLYELKNKDLWMAYHPRLSRYFLPNTGYVTPFTALDDSIEKLYTKPGDDPGRSSDITKPYSRAAGLQQGTIYAPEPLQDPESLRDWSKIITGKHVLVPEVHTSFQGALSPLSRRIRGEYAHGGLI